MSHAEQMDRLLEGVDGTTTVTAGGFHRDRPQPQALAERRRDRFRVGRPLATGVGQGFGRPGHAAELRVPGGRGASPRTAAAPTGSAGVEVEGDGQRPPAPLGEVAVVAGLVLVEHQRPGPLLLVGGLDHPSGRAALVPSISTVTAGSATRFRTQSDAVPAAGEQVERLAARRRTRSRSDGRCPTGDPWW